MVAQYAMEIHQAISIQYRRLIPDEHVQAYLR
jgi:hypothetical protein